MRLVTASFLAAARDSDWCAVVDDDGAWSARDLIAQAQQLAAQLTAAGPTRPTVLVQSENSRRLVAAALAVGMLGGTLALASAAASADDIAATVGAVQPDSIIGEQGQLDRWQIGSGALLGTALSGWQVLAGEEPRAPGRWQHGVIIGMTSGSTGRSKGVVHSEQSMRYAVSQNIEAVGLVSGEAIGVIVPVSATPAFAFGIYLSLQLRSTALLSASWSPAAALRRLAEHQASWLMCVPTQVLQLASAAVDRPGVLRGMHAITVGGGPMEPHSLRNAEQTLGVPLLRVFGMSECLGHTTSRLDDPPEIRLGLDGRPFPGTDLRVLDEAGAELGFGEAGRAQVKGPSLFLGYAEQGRLRRPDLTPDGYLETGDLVTRYEDGTIKVSGRIKEVIIRGGRNISVAEVETALLADARIKGVCAVPVPDQVLGEKVAVLVVSDEDHLTLPSVLAFLERSGVAKSKWPEFLISVPSLPSNHLGKVSRALARELAVQRLGVQE